MTGEDKVLGGRRTPVIPRSPAEYTRGRVFQLNGSPRNLNLAVATGETRQNGQIIEAALISPVMGEFWADASMYSPYLGTYRATILEIREGLLT